MISTFSPRPLSSRVLSPSLSCLVFALALAPAIANAAISSWQIPTAQRFVIDVFTGSDGSVYTFTYDDPVIRHYNSTTGALIDTIDLGRKFNAGRIVGNTLYAIGEVQFNPTVSIVDLPSRSILQTYFAGPEFNGSGASLHADVEVSPDQSRVYAKMGTERGLVEIDPALRSVVGSIDIASTNADIAFSPDGQTLYAVDGAGGSNFSYLYTYDAHTGQLLHLTNYLSFSEARQSRQQLAVNPQTGAVYVGYPRRVSSPSSDDYEITEFDPAGNIVRIIDPAFAFGEGLGITRDGSLLVAGNGEIYDSLSGGLVTDLASGIATHKVFMTDTGRAYIANYNSFFITVIDGLPVPEPATVGLVFTALVFTFAQRSTSARR